MPAMEQAVNAYYSITASEKFREIERLREKARHDEAQALYHAKQEGMQQGMQQGMQEGVQQGKLETAKNLIKMGMPLHQIAAATGLTQMEIERLRTAP